MLAGGSPSGSHGKVSGLVPFCSMLVRSFYHIDLRECFVKGFCPILFIVIPFLFGWGFHFLIIFIIIICYLFFQSYGHKRCPIQTRSWTKYSPPGVWFKESSRAWWRPVCFKVRLYRYILYRNNILSLHFQDFWILLFPDEASLLLYKLMISYE